MPPIENWLSEHFEPAGDTEIIKVSIDAGGGFKIEATVPSGMLGRIFRDPNDLSKCVEPFGMSPVCVVLPPAVVGEARTC